jgi:hypothetical protein
MDFAARIKQLVRTFNTSTFLHVSLSNYVLLVQVHFDFKQCMVDFLRNPQNFKMISFVKHNLNLIFIKQ